MMWQRFKILVAGVCACLSAHWVAAQAPLVLTNLQIDGSGVAISWSGGTGAYLLQRTTGMNDTNWLNLTALTQSRAFIPFDSDAAFFRVMDHTTRTNSTNFVLAFSAWLTGTAVRPIPLTNTASGFGSFYLDGTMLTYKINFAGLSGPPTAVDIRGPASASQTASLLHALGPLPSDSSGILTGQVALQNSFPNIEPAFLRLGALYVNICTAANPNGELRGQISQIQYVADLRGTNEVPTVSTAGKGSGQFNLIGNQLWYDVDYTNLSSSAMAAQMHGPATKTQNTNVIQTLTVPSGTSGKLTGPLTLTSDQLGALIGSLTYLNILTGGHAGGEIRGQILPLGTSSSGAGTQ